MTNKFFAPVATLAEITEINKRNISRAVKDYLRHVDKCNFNAAGDISDKFISRLAQDCAVAKSGLREIFRRSKGWNEGLQAIIVNGTSTHDPDYRFVRELADKILEKYTVSLDIQNRWKISRSLRLFSGDRDYVGRDRDIAYLKEFAPHAYRQNRPLNKIFQEFCKAIGVYDDTKGSQYQSLYAQLADELKGRKLDFKLFLSINPAHFLTMTNPQYDRRGSMLQSCHALNHDELHFGTGNSGYARDAVTFVAFTVANPDDAESLNNRKTTRQLFMYQPGNGVLLQSRLYNTSGGTRGKQEKSTLYRDLVQRTISDCENAINLWNTSNYDDNPFKMVLPSGEGFYGYADWLEFGGEIIKLSVRKDKLDTCKPFEIGTYGLCVKCGDEIYSEGTYYCDDCDEMERCAECGCRIDEDEGTWVHDENGDYAFVCDSCLEEHYHYCECCCDWHHADNCELNAEGAWICDSCVERFYDRCEDCGALVHNDNYYFAYRDGLERVVCSDCFESDYYYCEHCERDVHDSEIKHVVIDGEEYYVCRQCAAELRK